MIKGTKAIFIVIFSLIINSSSLFANNLNSSSSSEISSTSEEFLVKKETAHTGEKESRPSHQFSEKEALALSKVTATLLPIVVIAYLLEDSNILDKASDKIVKHTKKDQMILDLANKLNIKNDSFSNTPLLKTLVKKVSLLRQMEDKSLSLDMIETDYMNKFVKPIHGLDYEQYLREMVQKELPGWSYSSQEALISKLYPKLVTTKLLEGEASPQEIKNFFKSFASAFDEEVDKAVKIRDIEIRTKRLFNEFVHFYTKQVRKNTKKSFKEFLFAITGITLFRVGLDMAYFAGTGEGLLRSINLAGLFPYVLANYIGYKVIGDKLIREKLFPLADRIFPKTPIGYSPKLAFIKRMFSKWGAEVYGKTLTNLPTREVLLRFGLIAAIAVPSFNLYDFGVLFHQGGDLVFDIFKYADYKKLFTLTFSGYFLYIAGHNVAKDSYLFANKYISKVVKNTKLRQIPIKLQGKQGCSRTLGILLNSTAKTLVTKAPQIATAAGTLSGVFAFANFAPTILTNITDYISHKKRVEFYTHDKIKGDGLIQSKSANDKIIPESNTDLTQDLFIDFLAEEVGDSNVVRPKRGNKALVDTLIKLDTASQIMKNGKDINSKELDNNKALWKGVQKIADELNLNLVVPTFNYLDTMSKHSKVNP